MKYDQFVTKPTALDFTMAQAMEGETVEAQLLQLKSQLEPPLNILHDQVNAERAEIDKLLDVAQSIPAEATDSNVVLDDVLITAKSSIEEGKQKIEHDERVRTGSALRHGLSRSPIKPDPVQSFILLGIYGVIETVINAGFLNNAYMVAGPFEALMTAGMISLTNVAVSTAGGYFILRWLPYGLHTAEPNLPEFKIKRDVAWVAFLVFLGVMLEFHLTVGLVRAQESLHHIEHSIPRYFEILTSPEALFLVMVGMVLSCLSLKKGMSAFEDPYPGYGEKQRLVEQSRNELADLGAELKAEISERFADKREAQQQAEMETVKKREKYNHAVANYLKTERYLNRHVNQSESQMRLQTAMIIHHHRAAAGHGVRRIPMTGLEQFVHFDHYRVQNSPAFLTMPDFSKTKADLDRAEAAALQRLSIMFENATQPSSGD